MEFLRRAAKTWIAKLLLVLLVASFAVWGVSGNLFTNQSNAVVSVGDENVTPNEFLLAYNQTVGTFSQRFGRRLTTEEARSFGIEERIFTDLAGQAALTQQALELNLGLSSKRQADLIAKEEVFHDRVTGKFDEATFRLVLRNIGMTESQYLKNNAKTAMRTQIIDAVSDGIKAPETLLKAIANHRSEKRDVDYLILDPSILEPVLPPSDSVLSTYFNDNKTTYAAPEYRKIAYVKLQAQDIIDLDAVSEEDISQEYEARLASYSTQERRTIDQLVFADKKTAENALIKIKSDTSFDDIVKEQGKTVNDVAIGTFSKTTMPDQKLADAAFMIKDEGGTTAVIDGAFGPVIMRISKIEPAVIKSLEDVKSDIRQQLALTAASDNLLDIHDSYEDDRAGGMTLQEAAQKQGLNVTTIEMIDRAGLDQDGVTIANIPQSRDLVSKAFEADIDLETPPINIGSDGFVWFEVLDIIAARERTLDEVKDKVIANWIQTETQTALTNKAAELKKRLDANEAMKTLASELDLTVEKKIDLTRSFTDDAFNATTVQAAFAGPDGLTTIAQDATGEKQILMKVVALSTPPIDPGDDIYTQEATDIAASNSNEIISQFITRLQDQYGVSINRTLASHVLSIN